MRRAILLFICALGSNQHGPPPQGISSETPAWSPDGQRIVFSAGPWMQHQIYVMRADGSGARSLTSGEQNRWPSWSPDGKSIVFMSDRDGQGELYVMNADGSAQRRLTNTPVHEFAPAWSPRGELIVYLVEMSGEKQQVFSIRPDGTGARRLDGDHLYYGRLAFHPDGSQVFVAAHRSSAAVPGDRWKVRSRLYAIDPVRETVAAISDEGYESNPWPSPDGRTLVVDTGDGRSWSSDAGQWDLWLVYLNGGRRSRVTSTDANDWGAAWSPDGKRIVFSSGRNRVYALHAINADGTGRQVLTRTDRFPDQPGGQPR
jgi:TolB protein